MSAVPARSSKHFKGISVMDWWTSFTAGISSGVISGTIVGTVFHWLSGRHLRREAGRLQRLTNLIIRGMEEAKLVTFNRDASGEPVGLVFERYFVEAMGISDAVKTGTTVTEKEG